MDDFTAGETKAHLENLTETVGEIKVAMKEHNESDIKEFREIKDKQDETISVAKDAAQAAYLASQKVNKQEVVNEQRHQENSQKLSSIEEKVDKLNTKITTIYGFAGGVSLVVSFASVWLKDKIIGKG